VTRLNGIDSASFDAVVIGGGMAGAGVARDLALRGASVVLFEKGDFASGTSSKSSKLIHGGLRYLELFDFKLVRESLREKKTLERLAPHLVRPLPFLVPVYRGSKRGLITVRIGMWLYDLLTPGRERERFRVLRPLDALTLEPSIQADDLRGAGYYFDDLLLFPERLCLENALSAARHGARVHNYCEVEAVTRGAGGIDGVRVRDLLTGRVHTVRASVVVNCAGPWVDRLRELAGVSDAGRRVLRTTKGIHCMLPRMTERAVYLSTADDRMIFVIPWREFSMVGTTDTDFDGDLDRLSATREEVEYLLDAVRPALPDPRVAFDQVIYTYAGVRPLAFEEGAPASKVSRDHKVVVEGPEGRFLSITGTKLTCFRSLAEQVGDHVMRALGRGERSRTALLTLDGLDEEAGKIEGRAWMDVSFAGDHADAGRDLRPRLPARPRPRAEAARRHGPALPEQSGYRGPAPPCPGRRDDRLPPGLPPPPHGHRPERVSRPRLLRGHRPPDERAGRLVVAPARRGAGGLSRLGGAEPALPKHVIRAIVRGAWRGDAQMSRARNPTAIRLR
jgi:glycerol-3-phosphate dehydrogenase